jgi:VanZ family protein
MLPLRHRRLWIAASAALIVLVVLGSLAPGMPFAPPGQLDKLQHFGAYLVLALWFTGLYPRARYGWIAAALVVLGLAMELLQQAMSFGRVGEALDMTANATGVAVGIVLATVATGGWARQVESWLSRN